MARTPATNKGAFGRALKALLDAQKDRTGMSANQIAARAGINAGMLTHWQQGKVLPTLPHIAPLARALGVNPDELLTLYLSAGTNIGNAKNLQTRQRIPVLPWALIQHGARMESPDLLKMPGVSVLETHLPDAGPRAFAAVVHDESMAPEFRSGAYVVFAPASSAPPGSFVLAEHGPSGAVVFRELVQDGPRRFLRPLNTAVAALTELTDDWAILALVTEQVRRYTPPPRIN